MSLHIGAKMGEIAETVLLPGDPLRAKYIAETFLENVVCYNEVRGMYGYTGTFRGTEVSVQGTGMGIPSCSIYIHELISEYDVQTLIRVGTCGCIKSDVKLLDVILAQSACTDSQVNKLEFGGADYAPAAHFDMLQKAHLAAEEKGIPVRVGNVFSTDRFYHSNPDYWKIWADYGVLALEMETSALYTLAARQNRKALSVLTVSDHLISGEIASAKQRETALNDMIEISLAAAK